MNFSDLIKKTGDIIHQFNKRNIITKSEKFFDAPEKIKENVREQKSEEKSDGSIPNWVKIQR